MELLTEVHTVDDAQVVDPQHFDKNNPKVQNYLKELEGTFELMTSNRFSPEAISEYISYFRMHDSKIRFSNDFLAEMTESRMPHYMAYSIFKTVNSYGVTSWHLRISQLTFFLTLTGKASVRYYDHQHLSVRMSKRGYPVMISFEKGSIRPADALGMVTFYGNMKESSSMRMSERMHCRWIQAFLQENPQVTDLSPLYGGDIYCHQLTPYVSNPSIETHLDLLKASLPRIYQRKDVYRTLLGVMNGNQPMSVYAGLYPLLLTLARHKIDAHYLIQAPHRISHVGRQTKYHDMASLKNIPIKYQKSYARDINTLRRYQFNPYIIQVAENMAESTIERMGLIQEIPYREGVVDLLTQAKDFLDLSLADCNLSHLHARVPSSPSELSEWGDMQGHCVGAGHYQRSLSRGEIIVLGIFEGDTLISTLQLSAAYGANQQSFAPEHWTLMQLASHYNSHKPWHDVLAQRLEKEGLHGIHHAFFLGVRDS